MNKRVRKSWILLCALPIAALADPVTVTTHSTGTTGVENTIMVALGLQPYAGTAPLPYELTLTSTYDLEKIPTTSDYWAYDNGPVVVDFRIGSQVFHYEGRAESYVHRWTNAIYDQYDQEIFFTTAGPSESSATVHFLSFLLGLPLSRGTLGPLAPLDLDATGSFAIDMYPSNPNVPLAWHWWAPGETMSIQVSPVPEPASWGMLAAGLGLLWLRRRGGVAG